MTLDFARDIGLAIQRQLDADGASPSAMAEVLEGLARVLRLGVESEGGRAALDRLLNDPDPFDGDDEENG